MNYKFEFKEEEMDLVMEALMLYILRVDKEKKDTLIALFKRMMNKLIDERKKEVETKPMIKQYDILKPYEDANKSVEFVAVDEVVEKK